MIASDAYYEYQGIEPSSDHSNPYRLWFPDVSLVIVDGSSSQDLVQNGGPSALHVPKGQSDILSLGKISRPQSAHGFSSGKAPTAGGKRRSRRCPPGHRWNGRRCVPIRKR